MTDQDISRAIIAEFYERAGGEQQFIDLVARVTRDSIENILDGSESLDDLEACEKTVFGIRFEKRFIRALGLPAKISKKKNPHGLLLDTRVAGCDLDVKTTLGGRSWMIPSEALNQWCFVHRVNWRKDRLDFGLIKALPVHLRPGKNQDCKQSVNAEGQEYINWIAFGAKLSEDTHVV